MTLSYSRLEKLLTDNGLFVRIIYTISGQAAHIELYNTQNAQCFLMYIPSKYEVPIPPGTLNAYEIRYVEEKEFLISDPETEDIQDYSKLESYLSGGILPENIEKSLLTGYSADAVNTGMVHEESRDMRVLFGQMQRLRLCVKGLKYKAALQLRNSLCCVRRDDTLDYFYISGFKGENGKRLFVLTDLEVFFADPNSVKRGASEVRTALYRVLQENQLRNARVVNALMNSRMDVQKASDDIYRAKSGYSRCSQRLEALLERLSFIEGKVLDRIADMRNQPRGTAHTEVTRGQEVYKLEKQLDQISSLKQDVVKELHVVRSKEESLSLEIDSVLYDNAVMFDKISKNFAKLAVLH